jgi:tRNA threonylcarbamoyladenosine biosynthesis protein TsaE
MKEERSLMVKPAVLALTTSTAAQTQYLGECMGRLLGSGMVIRLNGDLGAGKTCFVQGLARGLQVPADYEITSPTYTLVHEYPGRLPFFHIDLYRLNSFVDAESIGLWDIFDGHAVAAVEWADRLEASEWPEKNISVTLRIFDDETRGIDINGSGLEINNLIHEVVAAFRGNRPNQLK